MANAYNEMRKRHEKEIEDFPKFFAFSQAQFNEGMAELGLAPNAVDQIVSIGFGGFTRRENAEKFDALIDRQCKELSDAIKADTDGTGFAYEMFRSELDDHEYVVTDDLSDTIHACGLTVDEVASSPALTRALSKATRDIKRNYEQMRRKEHETC